MTSKHGEPFRGQRTARLPWTVVGAIFFAAYVVHAAYASSTVCPVAGDCTSVHTALMQGKPVPLPLRIARLDSGIPAP